MLPESAQRRLARGVFAVTAAILLGSIPLELLIEPNTAATEQTWGLSSSVSGVVFTVTAMTFPLVGILILRKHPANRIGWILLAIGASWALSSAGFLYSWWGLVHHPGSVPGADIVAAVNEPGWAPGIGLMGTFLILLFPDGRLPSRRWRPVAWAAGLAILAVYVTTVFAPGSLEESPIPSLPNPLGVDQVEPLLYVALTLFPLSILACASSVVLRFRRSRGVERLQLKWLATAGAFVACMFVVTLVATLLFQEGAASGSDNTWVRALQSGTDTTYMLIPAAIGVAVLRHGLYGIDVVINRALVFGSLAAFITGVYVAIVVGIGAVIGQGNNSLALSIAATAVVAIAFQPVRERVQHFANRLVYGSRATPYEVLSDFASRMGGTYASADLLPRMARTIAEGMAATRADVWLKVGSELVREVTWPAPDEPQPHMVVAVPEGQLPDLDGDRVVPVRHQGDLLGAVVVRKKPGEPITPTEDRLLDDVASQAGLVLRNVRLIEELRGSRERLVRTQDTERRRLEHNLHDGAQQSLVSVALLLRMTQSQLGADPDRIGPAVEEAADQLQTAIEELRELARGIHPAILTERGLGPAITSLAERSPVPVTVRSDVSGRWPATTEGTVYFVVAEALTNIAKYAQATSATVTIEHSDDRLMTTVSDDGIGGADPSKGSGLRGLADRIAAVDGHLDIHSPAGHGTRLTCQIPVAVEPRSGTASPAPVAMAGALSAGQS